MFHFGQNLNPFLCAEAAHLFLEEISISGTDHIRMAGKRCTQNRLIRPIAQ